MRVSECELNCFFMERRGPKGHHNYYCMSTNIPDGSHWNGYGGPKGTGRRIDRLEKCPNEGNLPIGINKHTHPHIPE